jgi:hypothetical protein
MDLKKTQSLMVEKLTSHSILIRKRLEESDKHIPYRNGYIKTLLDIEEALSNQLVDVNRLRRDKFGIYRMLDGSVDTPIEQELMLLHDEIHDLLKASKDIDTHQKQ